MLEMVELASTEICDPSALMLREIGGSLPIPDRKDELTADWITTAFRDSGAIPQGANVRVDQCTVAYLSGDPTDPTSGGFTGNELLQANLTYKADDPMGANADAVSVNRLVSSLGLPASVAIKKFDLVNHFRGQPQGRIATWAAVKLARFHPALAADCESTFYARQMSADSEMNADSGHRWKLPTPKIFYNRMDAWRDPSSLDILLWGQGASQIPPVRAVTVMEDLTNYKMFNVRNKEHLVGGKEFSWEYNLYAMQLLGKWHRQNWGRVDRQKYGPAALYALQHVRFVGGSLLKTLCRPELGCVARVLQKCESRNIVQLSVFDDAGDGAKVEWEQWRQELEQSYAAIFADRTVRLALHAVERGYTSQLRSMVEDRLYRRDRQTLVHGDLHPGNMLLRLIAAPNPVVSVYSNKSIRANHAKSQIRFIDFQAAGTDHAAVELQYWTSFWRHELLQETGKSDSDSNGGIGSGSTNILDMLSNYHDALVGGSQSSGSGSGSIIDRDGSNGSSSSSSNFTSTGVQLNGNRDGSNTDTTTAVDSSSKNSPSGDAGSTEEGDGHGKGKNSASALADYTFDELVMDWQLAVVDYIPGLLISLANGLVPRVMVNANDRVHNVQSQAEILNHKIAANMLCLKIIFRSKSVVGELLRSLAGQDKATEGTNLDPAAATSRL